MLRILKCISCLFIFLGDGRSETCFLEKKAGHCFGFMERFAFNPENNRCEKFIYGGCQGNGNNFKTAQECMEECGGELPVTGNNK